MVIYYCESGRIEGAVKKGNLWLATADVVKPNDSVINFFRNSETIFSCDTDI